MWVGYDPNRASTTADAQRRSLFVVPAVASLFATAVLTNSLPRAILHGDTWLVVFVCVIWLGLGTWQGLVQIRNKRTHAIFFIAYYINSLVFVALVEQPSIIMTFWAIVLVITLIRFGTIASFLTMWSFFFVASAALIFQKPTSFEPTLLYSIVELCIVFIVSILIVDIIRSIAKDQRRVAHLTRQASIHHDRVMTLINNLADAVISTDRDGRIVDYNAATLNLLNTNIKLQHRTLDEISDFTGPNGEHVVMQHELHDAQTVKHRDDLTINVEGEQLRLDVTYSPIRGSYGANRQELSGYIVIMRDITREKSLEEERDEFISVVSHELRTPITIAEGAIGNTDVLISRQQATPEQLRASIKTAHDQVLFLARMVNDLSTLSRAERGIGGDTEVIDVAKLVQGIYDDHHREAAEKGLAFNIDMVGELGTIKTSRLYLKELLQNFVTNALKYTAEGSVTLRAERLEQNLKFTVTDTGIGISKSDQKHIFDKFYRAEDYRTRETSGTGLGLYVATKLAKKLGARITMQSRLNHGSEFSIILPGKAIQQHDEPAS